MGEKLRDYRVVSRWLDGGWQTQTDVFEATTLESVWREASARARQLDNEYGNSHFWTVDVQNPEGNGYVQLFHGRLE